MLDYARQRIREVLKFPHSVVFVTSGPAGVQASEYPCEAEDIYLYILIPKTSDHLFNLEYASGVTLLSSSWEMKGEAKIVTPNKYEVELDLLNSPDTDWCVLVQVEPVQVQIRREGGWGTIETIDLSGGRNQA